MKIHNLSYGGWASNCYYITDDDEQYAVVIDPSVPPDKISLQNHAQLCAVLLTHTHYDHMVALDAWLMPGAPLMVTEADEKGLYDPEYNVSWMFGQRAVYPRADRLLKAGDVITFGRETLEVIMTPGHTAGSCCYRAGDILFSGDTLFAEGGIGRYDLPGGSYRVLEQSLQRLLSLEPGTQVYPGHGGPTTIGAERHFHGII